MAERLERVQAAGAWHSLALAELAEAVAALVIEVLPRGQGGAVRLRNGRH